MRFCRLATRYGLEDVDVTAIVRVRPRTWPRDEGLEPALGVDVYLSDGRVIAVYVGEVEPDDSEFASKRRALDLFWGYTLETFDPLLGELP
jgi:hypothetical protein